MDGSAPESNSSLALATWGRMFHHVHTMFNPRKHGCDHGFEGSWRFLLCWNPILCTTNPTPTINMFDEKGRRDRTLLFTVAVINAVTPRSFQVSKGTDESTPRTPRELMRDKKQENERTTAISTKIVVLFRSANKNNSFEAASEAPQSKRYLWCIYVTKTVK